MRFSHTSGRRAPAAPRQGPAEPFRQRWPWIGPDLQTLRDVLRPEPLPLDQALPLSIPLLDGDRLLVMEDRPPAGVDRCGLVVLVHGLAGDSARQGVRQRASGLPLLGVGLSLGGTILLNALLEQPGGLDRLVCVSSPLDLEACSRKIAAPRNRLYAHWLLQRLIAQARADPFPLTAEDAQHLRGPQRPRSIRAFDARITAPPVRCRRCCGEAVCRPV